MQKSWILRGAVTASLLITVFALVSCDDGGDENQDRFDRSAMLQHYADELIIPAFDDLQTDVNALKTAVDAFVAAPDAAKLESAQQALVNAYIAWQYANAYNFGPAGPNGLQRSLAEEIGTWPASETKIESAISAGNSSLNDFNRDARGFIAIEYLLFDVAGDHASTLNEFQAANRKNYLTAVTNDIKAKVDAVVTAWSGTYKSEFVSNDGTSAGSSTSYIYNEFVKSYEALKNFKVALPLGLRVGQTQPEPALVEGYYSGKSLTFLKHHMSALENIWYGRKKDDADGIGFEEYLNSVEGGAALIAATKEQLQSITTALNNLNEETSMSAQIVSNPAPWTTLSTELQKNVRYFKGDMSSLLGIAITYDSGDGD